MKNRNLHIIMPMAGEGTRFSKEGYSVPKPLLTVDDTYFFDKAIHSLWNLFAYMYQDITIKFTFIVRQEHIDNYGIDKIIKQRYYNANVVSVEKTTRGAVETCLLASPYIDSNDSILVLDCDLWYYSNQYEDMILSALTLPEITNIDGVVLSFESTNPRYSYAATDNKNNVIQTTEKKPISNNALVGSYFFTYALDFISAANSLIKENSVNDIKEYYVSLLYNYLINDDKVIKCAKVNKYASFGTPEELKNYENKSNNY